GGGGRHVDADVDVRRVGGARGVVHADVPEVVALGGLHEVRLGEGAEAVEVEPLRLGGGERVGGAGGVDVHLDGGHVGRGHGREVQRDLVPDARRELDGLAERGLRAVEELQGHVAVAADVDAAHEVARVGRVVADGQLGSVVGREVEARGPG